jgi:hypothetical protein
MQQLDKEINQADAALDVMDRQLEDLKTRMAVSVDAHNSLLSRYNSLVENYNEGVRRSHDLVAKYNALGKNLVSQSVMEIGGGIGLDPSKFKVVATDNSPSLKTFITQSRTSGTSWTSDAILIRSASTGPAGPSSYRMPWLSWITDEGSLSGRRQFMASSQGGPKRWIKETPTDHSWRDQTTFGSGETRERYFDGVRKTLRVADAPVGGEVKCIEARLVGNDTIVFSRSIRKDLIGPKVPPVWWNSSN